MSNSIPAPNPFAPPSSNLLHNASRHSPPSIEEALSRGYDFSIGSLLGEAWQRTSGTKGIVIGGFAIFYVVLFAISFVLGFLLAAAGLISDSNPFAQVFGQLLISLFAAACTYPFFAGILMIGIRRAADQPIDFSRVFGYFACSLPLIVTGVVMTLLIYLGALLLLLPGIYLGIAYLLAMPLVVERGLSPWQALEASRKAITQHWFKVFGLVLLLSVIIGISALPLGIGLIWSLPLSVTAIGVLYRDIFGVLPSSD